MATLAAVCDEWPAGIADVVRKIRLEMLGMLRSRLEAGVANGELPTTTDIEGLSRFYLSVYQGMAVQARDGAGAPELRGVVAAAMSAWPSNRPRIIRVNVMAAWTTSRAWPRLSLVRKPPTSQARA